MPTYTLRELTEEEKKREKPVPGDLYLDAEVLQVNERTLPFEDDKGNPVKALEFKFKVLDEEYRGKWLTGEVRAEFTTSRRCQLRDWVQELFQQELQADFRLDTDMLIGKKCRVHTFVKKYTNSAGENKEVTIVNDVLRPTGGPSPEQLPSNTQDALEPF